MNKWPGYIATTYGTNLREFSLSSWVNQMLNGRVMMQTIVDNARRVGARIIDDEIIFEFKGYDPRNHHGRFANENFITWADVKFTTVIDFTKLDARMSAWYGHDPRNYKGSKL